MYKIQHFLNENSLSMLSGAYTIPDKIINPLNSASLWSYFVILPPFVINCKRSTASNDCRRVRNWQLARTNFHFLSWPKRDRCRSKMDNFGAVLHGPRDLRIVSEINLSSDWIFFDVFWILLFKRTKSFIAYFYLMAVLIKLKPISNDFL